MFKICRTNNLYYTCRETIDINEELCDYIETRLAINGYTLKYGDRIKITPEKIKAVINGDHTVGAPVFSEYSRTYVKLSDLIIDEIDDIFHDENERFVHFLNENYEDIDCYDEVIGG